MPKYFHGIYYLNNYLWSMNDVFLKILSDSFQIYRDFGIKTVSMDDICKRMHISKKTIYKYVKNKEDLLMKIFIDYLQHEFSKYSAKTLHENPNAIQYLLESNNYLHLHISLLTPSIKHDLKTYYPHINFAIKQFVIQTAHNFIERSINNGITQGLIKESIQKNVILHIYSHISLLFDSIENKDFTAKDISDEMMKSLIYSIGTSTGIAFYNSLKNDC